MKDKTMQEIGLSNQVHLCNSCCDELPGCDDDKHIIYGDGNGEDNIAACSSYRPVHIRNYEEERDITTCMG